MDVIFDWFRCVLEAAESDEQAFPPGKHHRSLSGGPPILSMELLHQPLGGAFQDTQDPSVLSECNWESNMRAQAQGSCSPAASISILIVRMLLFWLYGI